MSVSLGQLTIFTNQLASMLRSRLPLVMALDNLAEETLDRRIRAAVQSVSASLKSGRDLAEALNDHPKVFSPVYVALVRSGMETGRLADAVTKIADHLDRMQKIRSKMRTALFYPLLLAIGFVIILNIMIFLVLPRFEQIFAQFGKSLPWPTQILLAFGDLYTEHLFLLLVALGGGGFAALTISARPSGRRVWDKAKLALPVIGPVWRLSSLARFIHTLSVQIESSVQMTRALRLSAESAGNVYIAESIEAVASGIEMGMGVSESFKKEGLFAGVVQQMAASGEQTGALDEMMNSVALYFDSLWVQRLETLAAVVNPLMTAIFWFIIAAMMIAAFLPIFEVSGVGIG